MSRSRSGVNRRDILYLFYRPGEPLYYPKGDPEDTCYFELSPDYLPPRYKKSAPKLLNRFSEGDGRRVDIASLLSDALLRIPLKEVQVVKRRENFSLFLPKHRKAAGRLISIYMGLKNIDDFIAFTAYSRDRVNPELFVYALSIALVHRKDTKNLRLPPYTEVFPESFIHSEYIADAREQAEIQEDPNDRVSIDVSPEYTGDDSDPEHRMAYFREDLGVNLHHWHWHLIYPFEGPTEIVAKDRRGELFYYLHHELIARYNIERLCNGLNLVRKLQDWYEPIEEGYFPMLTSDVAGKNYPGRPAGMRLSDVDRPDSQVRFTIDDIIRFRERVYEAIHRKKVIDADGNEIDIDNERGIDILGNMLEASILTPNAEYYGSVHNMGHLALAYITDPQYRFKQSTGVMAGTNTAMRDPAFYRLHALIDEMFIEHKNTLSPYTRKELDFSQVKVSSIEICSYDDKHECRPEKNRLHTFMMKSDINMSRGLDFLPRDPVLARVTHLNHEDFRYDIKVTNTSNRNVNGTVRIFLGPRSGYRNFSLDLKAQKELMIELDRFVVELKPGENTIQRESTQSTITIPYEQTFRSLDANRPAEGEYEEALKFNYCGCGWPQHMLIPKGTSSGYPMVLFVVISNYDEDKVDQGAGKNLGNEPGDCRTGVVYCGLRDKKYPDKRPMGYPFDRPLRDGVETLKSFMTQNMASTQITVVHSDTVRQGNLVSGKSRPVGSNDVEDDSNEDSD